MIRLFTTLLLSFFFLNITNVLAQSNIPVSYPADYISQFKDIYVDDAGLGYVVGTCGVMRKTENGGQKWTTVDAPSSNDLRTITCAPNDCSKALTAGDGIYRLENGLWSDVTYEGYEQPGRLHWLTNQIAIHETTGDQYYRSTDAGLTWTEMPFIDFQQSNMSIIDAQNGYVFVDKKLYGTSDAWGTIDSLGYEHPGRVYDMTWLDKNNGWLFDETRIFYRTSDAGKTWTKLTDDSQLTSVNWFVAFSETHLVGAQITTSRIESFDGGVTWARTNFLPEGNKRVNENFHQQGDKFYLVGNQSQLLYSEKDFVDFYELDPYGRQGRIGPIEFHTDEVGYALAGIDLLITKDAGLTWSISNLPQVGRDLDILDNGDLIVLGSSRPYISKDQGNTFTEWIDESIFLDTQGPTIFSRKPNGDLYLMSHSSAYASADGGNTFTAINIGQSFTPSAIHFLDNMNGYAVGGQSQFMNTTDGGTTWTIGAGPANNIVDVYFLDEDHGWANTANSRYETFDKGLTWTSRQSTGGYDITYNAGDGSYLTAKFGSGNNGEVFRSKDDGETWEVIAYNCFSYRAGELSPSGKYFFASGDGFIVRHDLEEITTSVFNTNKSQEATKLKAYPNPTNGLITIELPESNVESQIGIYNLQGKLIHHEIIAPFERQKILNLASELTGIYFIRWTAENKVGNLKVIKN